VLGEEKRETFESPRSTAGQAGASFPLRLSLRWQESEGTPVLWFWCVDSRAVISGGAVGVVVAAPWWNKGAGGSSPSRRCLWRFRRAAGFVCSQIPRSGKRWFSGRGRRGEGGDLVLELLSPVLVFAMVRSAPASRWRCWGLCGGASVPGVRHFSSVYMSFDQRLSPCATTAVCERCCWSKIWAGGQAVADPVFRPRRCRRPAAVLGLEEHGVVPQSMCHSDFGSAGGMPLIRLTKPLVAMVPPRVHRPRRA
jgi:hypothetical protein